MRGARIGMNSLMSQTKRNGGGAKSAAKPKGRKYPCGRIDCKKQGTAYPVLELRLRGYLGAPAQSMIGMAVCPEHQKETAVADLVSDEGWAQILDAFIVGNRILPDRELTTMHWEPVDSEMAQEFRRLRGEQ